MLFLISEKREKLTEMLEDFCDEYLNEEYKQLSLELVEEMSQSRSVPFKRGKLEVWASAILYAIAQNYSLFDESNEVYITRKDILNYFNTTQSNVSIKAINIKDKYDLDNEIEVIESKNIEIISDEDFYGNIFANPSMVKNRNRKVRNCQQTIDNYKNEWGEEFFKEHEGHFWLIYETRPFMEALFEQADILWSIGEKNEAVIRYKYLLKLNPNDNQGIRDFLFPALLELNRLDEAQELFMQYKDDATSSWKYNKLLLDIKSNDSADEIEMQYGICIESNSYIVPYLISKKRIPFQGPPFYGIGDKNEAKFYAVIAGDTWRKDNHAVDVLKKLYKK